ncbi:uncharacterized protein LOC103509291 [Diaphorina citri]|jgi:hypothetical protein|uniref:Uncharacterized protein LOC103509291 n=1 Tax=Diaphorina citri TaxID=121845 RepID=A0A1S3D141_DIACI|nr:uncharacterized protein LOC103509291 [Diaphorina citri]
MTTAATDDFMDTHEAKRNEKLKKWMVKEEKRLGQEIDKEVDGYIPDWGSDFVEFYKRAEKRHRTTQMEKEVTTENKDEVTQYMPPHVRKAFSEDRMVNVTLLDRWLYEHCSNNTIEWITTQPPTKPTFGTHSSTTERLTTLAERLRTTLYTGTTPEYFTIPKAQEEFLLSDNFTFDEAKINRMLEVAHVNLRNLSFLRVDENWRRLSQGMYEIQFTTTPTPVDSEEVLNMFTDKLNYDYNQDTK